MKKIYLFILLFVCSSILLEAQNNYDFEDGNLITSVPGTITVVSSTSRLLILSNDIIVNSF